MGMYINPGNEGFRVTRRTEYVDKSGLIGVVNRTIGTRKKLNLISRPRRFGKSTAAQMLCAYYDKGCDSRELFDDLEIAGDDTYEEHLNQYDVIYLDITNLLTEAPSRHDVVPFIKKQVKKELSEIYSQVPDEESFSGFLHRIVEHTGNKFIAIIDEWDVLMRDRKATSDDQWEFLEFLRSLFKSSGTTDKIFAAAYMTGILPVKKDGSQSAISEFEEYTMFSPGPFVPYIGFMEEEVKRLCEKYDMDFAQMKYWYDGYSFKKLHSVYNPNSVMKAIQKESFESYWSMSSAASSLLDYINMDFDGLSKAAEELLAGVSIPVEVDNFENDPRLIQSKDDVLTLLIHFGYFSYDREEGIIRIPNEEIRMEFARAVRRISHMETIRRVRESDQLILDTIEQNEEAVAAQIEKVHREECTPLHYNNEQSLRSVIKLAYFVYKDNFVQLEELPGGKGYADIVYLPKKRSDMPILLIELKWDKEAEGAIGQIKKKEYPKVLEGFGSQILLVGVSYDKEDGEKKHSCKIEEWEIA